MMNMIPIAKPFIDDREKEKVLEVMDTGMLASGQYVRDFEEKFASYAECKYGIATTSGTTALQVAVEAAGIKEGDRVLTTPFTFIASSNSILFNGAEPVFVDIDEKTFNIDPELIRKELENDPDISALLIVHLYGLSCNMDEIMDLVKEYDLTLIEDCAQSHGARYRGKPVGSFGDVSIFSFYPTKNMTTSEGGMIVTDDEEIGEKSKLLVNHGSSSRYRHEILGFNYRMTNIEAAIGLVQLEKIDNFNQKRKENAAYFTENFKDLDWLQLPYYPKEADHVFHLYTVKVDGRKDFASYLKDNGIGYGIHYPEPIYNQKLYQDLGYDNYQLKKKKKTCERCISLPVHPALTDKELKKIVNVVSSYK